MSGLSAFVGDFSDLGEVGPVHFQGGVIFLRGYGCPSCGNGFWTEADNKRRLRPERDACRCPHCGDSRKPPAALSTSSEPTTPTGKGSS